MSAEEKDILENVTPETETTEAEAPAAEAPVVEAPEVQKVEIHPVQLVTPEDEKKECKFKKVLECKYVAKVAELAAANKKLLIVAAAAVCLLIAVIVGLGFATNNYKTPIKTIEKYANAKEYTLEKMSLDFDGGLAKKQLKKIYKLMRNSDYFLDLEEEIFDDSISNYEYKLDKYGEDFKITYTILDSDELTKKDLRAQRSLLQEYVYSLESIVDETEEYTASDWGEVAEDIGLLKSETKELIELIRDLAEEYGRIEVTDGYELDVLVTTTGEELDEPMELELEYYVYKVNGRWVADSSFGRFLDIMSDVG